MFLSFLCCPTYLCWDRIKVWLCVSSHRKTLGGNCHFYFSRGCRSDPVCTTIMCVTIKVCPPHRRPRVTVALCYSAAHYHNRRHIFALRHKDACSLCHLRAQNDNSRWQKNPCPFITPTKPQCLTFLSLWRTQWQRVIHEMRLKRRSLRLFSAEVRERHNVLFITYFHLRGYSFSICIIVFSSHTDHMKPHNRHTQTLLSLPFWIQIIQDEEEDERTVTQWEMWRYPETNNIHYPFITDWSNVSLLTFLFINIFLSR